MTQTRAAIVVTFCCSMLLLVAKTQAATEQNLIVNGEAEGPSSADRLPPHWSPMIVSTAASFATDESEKHGGRSSIRITAPEPTRSYARSEIIPVAPGETIHGAAWVKVKDVDLKEGLSHVIMIAEFTDAKDANQTVLKFDVAKIPEASKGWTKIEGSVKVPELMANLRVRVGFSYCHGTCWWDDMRVWTDSPLACRIDLAEARLTPAMKTLPVLVLNRNGGRETLNLAVELNKSSASDRVKLTGEPTQRIDVPIAMPKPGKVKATATIARDAKAKPIFTEDRNALMPPPMVLYPPVPTHWAVEDGKPHLECKVDLATTDQQRAGAVIRAEVRDGSGKAIAAWMSDRAKGVADGVTDFAFDVPQIPEGDYKLVVSLQSPSGSPLSVERTYSVIPRRRAKVTINSAGYCEYDGKAIFPLGIFNGGKFKEQGDAGFTVTHTYNASRISNNQRPEDAEAERWLNESDANGMKLMLMVPMKHVFAGDWDAVRRRVRLFRNHPGLLCWDEEEGFARGDFKPDTLKTLRQIISEEDPNHPFMVGDPKEIVSHIKDRSNFFPLDEMDMGMWWWYPFPLQARAADALEGEEASKGDVLDLPVFLTRANTTKPIWLGVQAYKKNDKSRYPTSEEYRSQAYLGVIHGARGLMWYGGSVTGGIFVEKATPQETHWDDLKKLARELHDLSGVFMAPTVETPKASPETLPVDVCIKQSGPRLVMIAASRSTKDAEVRIASPRIKTGGVKVLSENRDLRAAEGSIADHFAPLAVHVYELTR